MYVKGGHQGRQWQYLQCLRERRKEFNVANRSSIPGHLVTKRSIFKFKNNFMGSIIVTDEPLIASHSSFPLAYPQD